MDRKIQKTAWYKRTRTWIMLGIVALVGTPTFFALVSSTDSKFRVEKEKLSIKQVEYDHFQDYIAITGTVMPIRTVYLDAMVGGRVEELLLEEGAMVKKGEKILRLSNLDLNLNIMNSEAELAEKANFLRNTRVSMEQDRLNLEKEILELEYKIKKQKRDFLRKKEFFQQGLIAKEEFLVAKEDYEYSLDKHKLLLERRKQDSIYRKVQVSQLENSLQRMEGNLNLVNQKLENLVVQAPISGQLGLLDAQVGEQKKQGERLGLINDLSAYKIRAEIDEHYISRIKRGLLANFVFSGQQYELRLRKVFPEVRNGRFEVDLIFTGQMPKEIRAGQTFRTKLQLGQPKKAMLLPRGSFYQSTGGQWIYVLAPSGEYAEKRSIRIGSQNPRYYEVLEGLKDGEQVVISGYENFGDADKLIFK